MPEVCRNTISCGLATGSKRSTTAFITLNTAVFAPMPSANVRIAAILNAGA
jgi:hypothetical protein